MIQTSISGHATPNPNARKYILPAKRFAQPQNFSSIQAAAVHPLAASLFTLDGVYNVFFAQDFITINKLPHTPWETLESSVQKVIIEYLDAHPSE
jgi:hypothetical protein